jgi:hypothetical protein
MRKLLHFIGRDAPGAPGDVAAPAPERPDNRYDALTVDEVLAHLDKLKPDVLAKLRVHEHAHQNRATVLARIDVLLDSEPWLGYDALDVDGVRSVLDEADGERLATVLAYERAHQNRAGIVLAAQQHSGA